MVDKTLKERTEALASTIGFGAAAIDKSLKERIALLATSIGEGTRLSTGRCKAMARRSTPPSPIRRQCSASR